MAQTLPINIPTIKAQTLASYNFVELLTQQGILEVYPAILHASGGTFGKDYILTTNSIYSGLDFKETVADSASIDIDFDITIGKAFDVLEGVAYFNVPYTANSNTSQSITDDITYEIRHYDGSSETVLATGVFDTGSLTVGGNLDVSYIMTGKMSISSKHFKVGEILRVNISMTAGNPSGVTDRKFGFDPANRSDAGFDYGTRSTFYIPVKLST